MRRTVKRTLTVTTTTHYTISWDAEAIPAAPAPAPEPDLIVRSAPLALPTTPDPPSKEPTQAIAEQESIPDTNLNSDRPNSSTQTGETP